jgi:hypothetical protein
VTRGAARAAHTHQELTEAVVELLDVNQDAHPRMVRRAESLRPCSIAAGRLLDTVCWTGRTPESAAR